MEDVIRVAEHVCAVIKEKIPDTRAREDADAPPLWASTVFLPIPVDADEDALVPEHYGRLVEKMVLDKQNVDTKTCLLHRQDNEAEKRCTLFMWFYL